MPPPPPATPLAATEDLTVEFPAVRALDGVDLELWPGEVHGLVGENGAGKSTLMRVLAGLVRPTSGRLRWQGRHVHLTGPLDARRLGVAMVHQELDLVEGLTVADNIFLGREPRRLGLVDARSMRREAQRLLVSMQCALRPESRVGPLAVADRQMVEIAKALSQEARLLVLDEPTAVLTHREVAVLFRLVARLRQQERAVVFVSHNLREVLELCDRITVLRDGRRVTTLDPDAVRGTDEERLAALMVGRPPAEHFPARSEPRAEAVLEVRDLQVPGRVRDVSFQLRRGEVLGFSGLVGAGRTEVAEALAGLRPRSGTVRLEGRPLPPRDPGAAVRAGMAYVSEDRRGRGLVMGMDVCGNITLPSLERYARVLVRRRAELRAVRGHVQRLGIRTPSLTAPVEILSGGNQQKVALARWLETRPRVLLLDEPTRGVDIGAKEEIYRLVRSLASEGLACMLVSSELNEILGMCHRVVVMRGGRMAAVLDNTGLTEEEVMNHAAGVGAAG